MRTQAGTLDIADENEDPTLMRRVMAVADVAAGGHIVFALGTGCACAVLAIHYAGVMPPANARRSSEPLSYTQSW